MHDYSCISPECLTLGCREVILGKRVEERCQFYCSHSLLLVCNADSSESGATTGKVGGGAGLEGAGI